MRGSPLRGFDEAGPTSLAGFGEAAPDATQLNRLMLTRASLSTAARRGERIALPDLSDDVGRLVLRLVIRARQHLGEQAEAHELHAGENQQDAEQQQRPVADPLRRASSRT